ncbi:MAG TPA: thioredoxin domain-containing protein [Chlamydiales bacterium]|nr:thioredoxin domain-containing protein [Chlamydiales bacterium]
MNKLALIGISISSFLFGVEKLDSKYWIQYGPAHAKFHAIEYFSFSCPKCLEFFVKEFPSIKNRHIDSGDLSWAFHPDPADLLTLQAMVCLDRLSPTQKMLFFEAIMNNLTACKEKGQECALIQAAMEAFKDPQPDLEDLDFLKTTQAFQDAFAFVSQKDAIQVIPSVEIDGRLYEQIPNLTLVDAHIRRVSVK